MEHVGNLSIPCPLHEQPKDEIIVASDCARVPNCLVNRRKHFAGNFNTCVNTVTDKSK